METKPNIIENYLRFLVNHLEKKKLNRLKKIFTHC